MNHFYSIISLLALSWVVDQSLGIKDSGVVRNMAHPDGSSSVFYSDGGDYMVAEFSEEGQLLDCAISKGNMNVTRNVLREIMENGTPEQRVIDIDIPKLTRKCVKFQRDMARGLRPHLQTIKDRALGFQRLLTTVNDTTFCTMSKLARYMYRRNTTNDADACCLDFKKCGHIIKDFSENYYLFNPFPYTLSSCACLDKLNMCLDKAEASEAKRQTRAKFFSKEFNRCFTLKEEMKCLEWDDWGTWCKRSETKEVATLHFKK